MILNVEKWRQQSHRDHATKPVEVEMEPPRIRRRREAEKERIQRHRGRGGCREVNGRGI